MEMTASRAVWLACRTYFRFIFNDDELMLYTPLFAVWLSAGAKDYNAVVPQYGWWWGAQIGWRPSHWRFWEAQEGEYMYTHMRRWEWEFRDFKLGKRVADMG
jgi:hypothetical protein